MGLFVPLLGFTHHSLKVSFDQFLSDRETVVSQHMAEHLKLMDGSFELLVYLKQRGIPMAVASSGTRAYVGYYCKKGGKPPQNFLIPRQNQPLNPETTLPFWLLEII